MWQAIWDFIGTPQFAQFVSFVQIATIVLIVPLYRRIAKLLTLINEIPAIKVRQAQLAGRVRNIERRLGAAE